MSKKKTKKQSPDSEIKNEIEDNSVEIEKSTELVENKNEKDDTLVSFIDPKELNHLIDEDLQGQQVKGKKHYFVHFFLILLLLVSCAFFGLQLWNKNSSILAILSTSFLTVFTILFVVISITYQRKNKVLIFFSGMLLLGYFLLEMNSLSIFQTSIVTTSIPNFQGKTLTDAVKWANKNNISIHQEYEYNDMISEYQIIGQNIKEGTSIKDVKEITFSISEGPNPAKEIIVPNMVSWDSERVIRYVKDNYLSNVEVEFVESDQAKDTVISQSTSGNLKRNDELKITFSYGEELGFEEVTLIDLTKKSKFEIEFYFKQHQLRYDLEYDFSNKVKRGLAVKQSVDAGTVIPINDTRVVVTISKGKKVIVPDLTTMSLDEITEWAISKKVKLNFHDQYDDNKEKNKVISAEFAKDEVIEQGTVVNITISKGPLKMPKFKSINDFYSWANQYNIHYEEEHEFNDNIAPGEVISYSYKTGEAIKNNDTIIVKISDGEKKTVPNVVGLSKSEAIAKMEKAGIAYHFIYKNSNDISKDKVISQSIRSGSEISSGASLTITLSNGKADKANNNSKSEDTNKNNENSNENKVEEAPPQQPVVEEEKCTKCTITGIKGIISSNISDGYQAVADALTSEIKSQCPGIKVSILSDDTTGRRSGTFISGFNGGNTDSCSTVSIVLAK